MCLQASTRSSLSCTARPNAAVTAAERLLELGLYVIAFSYPVVPHGKARIRTQLSAAHTAEDVDFAIECFKASRG